MYVYSLKSQFALPQWALQSVLCTAPTVLRSRFKKGFFYLIDYVVCDNTPS